MSRIPNQLKICSTDLSKLKQINSTLVIIKSLTNIGLFIFLYIAASVLHSWWIWSIVWFFQGIILSGFLGASHDCAHNTFLKSNMSNRIFGIFWSSIVLFNFSIYKYYHLEHHKYTTIEGDTEPLGVFKNIFDYLKTIPMHAFFIPFWKMSYNALFNKYPHFVKTLKEQKEVKFDNIGLATWILIVLSLTILFPYTMLFAYWLPILVYFPMVFFTSIPEHYGCIEGPDLLVNTRSIKSNFLFRYVFWNGNFHAEHHVYPQIPSNNLLKLHSLIGGNFKFRESGYIKFHIKMITQILTGKQNDSENSLNSDTRVNYENYKSS